MVESSESNNGKQYNCCDTNSWWNGYSTARHRWLVSFGRKFIVVVHVEVMQSSFVVWVIFLYEQQLVAAMVVVAMAGECRSNKMWSMCSFYECVVWSGMRCIENGSDRCFGGSLSLFTKNFFLSFHFNSSCDWSIGKSFLFQLVLDFPHLHSTFTIHLVVGGKNVYCLFSFTFSLFSFLFWFHLLVVLCFSHSLSDYF